MKRINQLVGGGVLALLIFGCNEQPKKTPLKKEVYKQATAVGKPIGQHSSLPFLFSNGERTLLSWVEKENDSLTLFKYAELKQDIWQPPQEIVRSADWFVNWADFPMLAENKGNLWSHVLKKSSAGTYSYDVKMNVLPKGAREWKTNMPLHNDNTPTEHGFVTALPYKEAFFVTWLDGRNTLENEVGERGAMTIRAAEVSANGDITVESELDARTCDCCQTTAAITANGPVVLYRDRSEEEIRDISIVRWVDGQWTQPKPIHQDGWKINGCPVNGPKAAALGNTLVTAWFTAAQENPRVHVAFSQDSGAGFGDPIRIDKASALGRVDVVLVDTHTALVSWMESKDKNTVLKAVKVLSSGTQSKPLVISTMDESRNSGFPQMELVGNKVYFAWTAERDGSSNVKTAYVPLEHF